VMKRLDPSTLTGFERDIHELIDVFATWVSVPCMITRLLPHALECCKQTLAWSERTVQVLRGGLPSFQLFTQLWQHRYMSYIHQVCICIATRKHQSNGAGTHQTLADKPCTEQSICSQCSQSQAPHSDVEN